MALVPVAVSASASALALAEPVPYVLDDGTGGFNIGPSQFDAVMTWGNAFVAVPGGEVINAVSISFGDIDDNMGRVGSDVVTIAILDDPDEDAVGRLDPANAVLRSVMTVTWQDTGFSEFARYDIEPTLVSGSFFIAVQMEVVQRSNPAAMDPTTLGVGSWLFFSPESVLDDLGQAPFAQRGSESAFQGTWMVRAEGVAETGCAADFDGDDAATVFDILAYLDAWTMNDPRAEFTGDETLNVFDILAYLEEWDAGCP